MHVSRPRSFSRALLSSLAALTACTNSEDVRDARPELTVFAASSVTEVVQKIAETFEPAQLRASFGASSDLARQIAEGAPADFYISASRIWIERLRDQGRIDGEPVVFATNELVAVAACGSSLAERGVRDVGMLLGSLADGDRVAIADEGVPAGDYARQALRAAGKLEGFGPRLVGLKDVRAVVHAVETGEAAAGFVYATDARIAEVERLFAFDPASHEPIEYLAGIVRSSPLPEAARAFLAHLRSDAARSVLVAAGFGIP